MNLHIVGGFLGSGKTTAIMTAASHLIKKGYKVGVVTNDRGKQLVDTKFFKNNNVLTVEIAQGCFRCSIDELIEKLRKLEIDEKPDIVFAESVGTCGDLVATVIEPLSQLEKSKTPPTSFSVFADSQLLLAYLQKEELPFSEIVMYTYEKQIEESTILIINKIDLLNSDEKNEIIDLAKKRYPEKVIYLQNSKEIEDVIGWIDLLETDPRRLSHNNINVDYSKYGLGEISLAWVDLNVLIDTLNNDMGIVLKEIFNLITNKLISRKVMIGHMKFFVSTKEKTIKTSITAANKSDWDVELQDLHATGEANLLINARVEIEVNELLEIFKFALNEISRKYHIKFEIIDETAIHPNFPVIPYRITKNSADN